MVINELKNLLVEFSLIAELFLVVQLQQISYCWLFLKNYCFGF